MRLPSRTVIVWSWLLLSSCTLDTNQVLKQADLRVDVKNLARCAERLRVEVTSESGATKIMDVGVSGKRTLTLYVVDVEPGHVVLGASTFLDRKVLQSMVVEYEQAPGVQNRRTVELPDEAPGACEAGFETDTRKEMKEELVESSPEETYEAASETFEEGEFETTAEAPEQEKPASDTSWEELSESTDALAEIDSFDAGDLADESLDVSESPDQVRETEGYERERRDTTDQMEIIDMQDNSREQDPDIEDSVMEAEQNEPDAAVAEEDESGEKHEREHNTCVLSGCAFDGVLDVDDLTTPSSVERDRQGNLYIAEPDARRVRKVSVDGFVMARYSIGGMVAPVDVAVCPNNNNVYVADGSSVLVFDNSGEYLFSWNTWKGQVLGLAADDSCNIFVVVAGWNGFYEYAATGTYLAECRMENRFPLGIAASNDLVYISLENQILAVDSDCRIVHETSIGSFDRQPSFIRALHVEPECGFVSFASYGGPRWPCGNPDKDEDVFFGMGYGDLATMTTFGSYGNDEDGVDAIADINLDESGHAFLADYCSERVLKFYCGPETEQSDADAELFGGDALEDSENEMVGHELDENRRRETEGEQACLPVEMNCGDGEDNDCDGKTDCRDEDCSGKICAAGKVCISGHCERP